MAIKHDFANPEMYTDEYAEEHSSDRDFIERADTPLYSRMRKDLEEGRDFEKSLEYNVDALLPAIVRSMGSIHNVVIGEDGENLTMPWDVLDKQQKFYEDMFDVVLTVGRPLWDE